MRFLCDFSLGVHARQKRLPLRNRLGTAIESCPKYFRHPMPNRNSFGLPPFGRHPLRPKFQLGGESLCTIAAATANGNGVLAEGMEDSFMNDDRGESLRGSYKMVEDRVLYPAHIFTH